MRGSIPWIACVLVGCAATTSHLAIAPVAVSEAPSTSAPVLEDEPTLSTPEEPAGAWNSFLTGGAAWTECSLAEPLSYMHPDCVALRPVRVTTSTPEEESTAVRAVDLDACTAWNSGGFAPAWIELDFGEPQTIAALVIDPASTPTGAVATHILEADDGSGTLRPRATLRGNYYSGVLYALTLPEPIVTRRLRIRSTESPSWIAWHEIVPLACSGPVQVWVAGYEPDPPPAYVPFDPHAPGLTITPGQGACRTDADCAPVACCNARGCGSVARAPDCSMMACPADCAGPMACGHGGCGCFDGVCGMATR